MAAVLLLLLFLLLRFLGERLFRDRILVKIEVVCLDVVELIAEASADRNHARSLHIAHVNLSLSATFSTFVKAAALVCFDLNTITPCACPSFHLADILIISEIEPLALDIFRHLVDNMSSWIVITFVMERYAIDERPFSINIDS